MNEAMSHGNMIIFLLLAFSVATVRAETGVGCRGGWVHFICESPDNNRLPMSRTRIINDKVVVKNLQQEDNGTLCPTPDGIEFRIMNCTKPVKIRTVYNKAQTTMKCGRADSIDKYGPLYFCKETGDFDCKDVSFLNTHGKYSMSQGRRGLNVTIKHITPEDQGIYWCAEHQHLYDLSHRKFNVTVRSDFVDHQKNGIIGEDIEVSCEYPKEHPGNKFFGKGEDPHTCEHLATSSRPNQNTGKFRLEDSETRINVTIFSITAEDKGTYWFGCESVTEHGEEPEPEIFCRLELTLDLVPADLRPEKTSFILSIVTLCVCVAVLVLLVVFIVLIKKGKRRNDPPPQNNRQEEYVYEEVQSPTARKAVKDSLHYMTVDFGESGNTSESKPSSSQCQYSTVFNKRADTCTIQAAPSEEPLYCNVNTRN